MSNSRTKKSVNNMIIGFINQATTLVLNFILRSVFIKMLGVELLGINGLFLEVLSLLSMVDLGFNTAIIYSFYKPLADKDTRRIAALTNFYKKIYTYIAIVIATVGIVITPFIKYIINVSKPIPMLEVYYLFALGGVVSSYLYVYKTSIITADQKNYIITYINIIINFIKTVLQIISLIVFRNFIVYLAINLIFNFVGNYIASKKAENLYPYIRYKYEIDDEDKKSIFRNVKSIFLYKVSGSLLNATDNTLISIIIGTIAVGYYSNYLMITNKISALVYIIFGSLTASIGNIIVKEDYSKRYEIFKATQSISFIICGIVVTSFSILVNDLITVWLGGNFTFDLNVVLVISLNLYLSIILQPLWTYREATGLYLKTKYIMFCAALLNIILSIVLGKLMGISGILLASSISRLCTYFWYEPFLLFKEYFNEKPLIYYRDIFINFIIVLISIVVFSKVLSNIRVTSWTELFIKSIICGVLSALIFFMFYCKSEGVNIIINKLKRR